MGSEAPAQYAVQAFDTLKPQRKEGEAEALALLKQAAWQVQPIMKRHQWTVLLLKELEPENMTRGVPARLCSASLSPPTLPLLPGGDNLNRGEQVRIKVRRPEGGLYSYEHGAC
jgi:hypothetical protein